MGAERAIRDNGYIPHCVFSSDIDKYCQEAYYGNFGDKPHGDISEIPAGDIPNHDILLAGFPCQPFSIIGKSMGFDDTRGTLFFEIARIIDKKRPLAFVLENVKRLASHDNGETLKRILSVLRSLDYYVDYKILNALDFGLPQKRERIWIVGHKKAKSFCWPSEKSAMKQLKLILEEKVPTKAYASDRIRVKRMQAHTSKYEVSIWHENKSGNISSYPYACALRANASYNYMLVNGERRLTPRELLRLQGFPDSYRIVCSDSQTRKQAGNSLPVPVAAKVIDMVINATVDSSKGVKVGT